MNLEKVTLLYVKEGSTFLHRNLPDPLYHFSTNPLVTQWRFGPKNSVNNSSQTFRPTPVGLFFYLAAVELFP